MGKQDTLISRKRKGPVPTGKGSPILVRLQPEPLAAVDAWREDQPDKPTRPEAIRRLVEKGLEK